MAQKDATYTMGRTEEETQRLIDQSKLYETNTQRLLEDAGIQPGMKILDVGSGAGDVAMLAARLVGPTGSVIGIDQNPEVLKTAKQRASESDIENVEFIEGDLRENELPYDFDGAIGRLILMYTADPAETIAAVAKHVRKDGFIGFQEMDFSQLNYYANYSESDLYKKVIGWMLEVFEQSGAHLNAGLNLHEHFLNAGLTAPSCWAYTPIGGPANWPGYEYGAQTFRSLIPLFEEYKITTAEELDIDTWAKRMVDEVTATGKPMALGTHVSGWTRIN